jgi:hypothetical protein
MLGHEEIMGREEKVVGAFLGGFVLLWILSALAGLAGSGLVLYILYRLATHPW